MSEEQKRRLNTENIVSPKKSFVIISYLLIISFKCFDYFKEMFLFMVYTSTLGVC